MSSSTVQPVPSQPSPCTVGRVTTHGDDRGELSVIESLDVPFDIKRIYYIHGVPAGQTRGEHGHRRLEQVMVCMSGAVEIMVSDGERQDVVTLDDPSIYLHVPSARWRRVTFRDEGSVLCVLASTPFDASDYMHDYDEFVAWKKSGDRSDG